MKRYNPQDIEPKWQKIWQETELYKAVDFDETRPKYVMLTEFPYPSGDGLHLGHVREYTLGDIMAREKRMAGYNVLYPMAYDAFGLPTENYAIKNKVTPQAATETNTGNFQKQFKSLGYGIDWSRTFKTSDPEYYKWTQWLFLQFFNEGLAYQDEIAINWCPHCKTGLANEEVVNGRHERCDTVVEKKLLKQWMLKITKYADRLIEGLKDVDYPAAIADQQINWIGRSKGAEITFAIDGSDESLHVFTTRPDTLYGVTFMVVAPEHELVERITSVGQRDAVRDYVRQAGAKSDIERQETDREKTGVFTGAYAINPVNKEKIPIWVADYVLNNYGTGAIMAVPAHDERDSTFAEVKGLEVRVVVDAKEGSTEGILVNSDTYSGMSTAEAREKIVADLEKQGVAKERVNYKLRDWIFSRQHYWGEPIPIIHCQKDGAVPVPLGQLPVELPKVTHYEPTDTGKSPLSEIDEWVNVTCPKCGGPAVRETDTMPNWAGSSWYYLRYFDAHNDTAFVDKKKLDYWRDVDLYLGGMEHTTLHLLYSRFWHQFFYDQGLVPTPEPYKARRGQGIVLAADGSKMSKSKGNIINPNHIIDQGYGADALRMAIAFLAPFEQTTPWSDNGVAGTYRFLQRFWVLVQEFLHDETPASDANSVAEAALHAVRHKAVKKVGSDLQHMNFNTAVAALMEGVNGLYRIKNDHGFAFAHETWREALIAFTQLLAPFAPHLSEEIWQEFGQDGSVHISAWPVWDEAFLQSETVTIVVQVNGKVRTSIVMPKDAVETEVVAIAREDENVATFIVSEPKRIIFVPNKLINFVV